MGLQYAFGWNMVSRTARAGILERGPKKLFRMPMLRATDGRYPSDAACDFNILHFREGHGTNDGLMQLWINTTHPQYHVLGMTVHTIYPIENCKILNLLDDLCHSCPDAMQLR
ncbi:uncharacterized protein N7518_008908 [Penicillium psychrosexuale]|uniref:uncharacterized protein n=1 Tax=Penicillium psychrosexuale TaxID=1002107 RepID=UPI002544EC86|nr:uncharacterized protein N7518_008908 [Penicillium psychrosexuale]KAJ5791897.1 hypothetical protein N7518_008908 [Penicillium psychrosexuale]